VKNMSCLLYCQSTIGSTTPTNNYFNGSLFIKSKNMLNHAAPAANANSKIELLRLSITPEASEASEIMLYCWIAVGVYAAILIPF